VKKETWADCDGVNLRKSVFTKEEAIKLVEEHREIESIEEVEEFGDPWWVVNFKKKDESKK